LKNVYQSNFLIGAAAQVSQLTHAQDMPLLQTHFNSITAEYQMKADIIGPSEGVYNFADGDALAAYCQANATQLRGHALLWHQTTPAWFLAGGNAATIRARLEAYVTAVVTHFAGDVYAWDVVNEVVADDNGIGIGYRNSNWYQAVGPDYIEWAFNAAKAADPNCKLFINEYQTENSAKRGRLIAIVQDLLGKGVPVEGVGHQLHMNIFNTAPQAADAIDAIEAAFPGMEQHVTELDVSAYQDPGSCFNNGTGCSAAIDPATQQLLSTQANLYRALFNAFAARPNVTSVTTWGVHDAQTWLNTFPITRANHPLLFDRNRAPKTAFYAVDDATFVIP
jgi:endo-1,4-beta-xylanase